MSTNRASRSNEEWVAQIKQFIDLHSAEPLSLDYLAQACHSSPFICSEPLGTDKQNPISLF